MKFIKLKDIVTVIKIEKISRGAHYELAEESVNPEIIKWKLYNLKNRVKRDRRKRDLTDL